MFQFVDDGDDADLYELQQERANQRKRMQSLMAAPDYRDPEHPEDEEESDEEVSHV